MPSSAARRRIMLWRKGVRRCSRCGEPLDGPDQATLEHAVPRSAGGRTTRANLTLSHPHCNRRAGRALWLERRGGPTGHAAENQVRVAEFWYENLLAIMPSSRVPSPRDPAFQIIGAIESSVTIAEGSGIRELETLEKLFGKGSWLKRKGQAIIRLKDGTIRRAELHWYEAHGIGRHWIKVKRYLDL
ncbi:MAG: HNH endonuclease [Gemmatimonadetes bacterium]|nr:HNH endonuclease [Gemmatimonadota bacterium]